MTSPVYRFSSSVMDTMFPPIPEASGWISDYSGPLPMLNMSQGVPGVSPPAAVQHALARASSSEASFGYTGVAGETDLRTAAVQEMKHIYMDSSSFQSVDIAVDDIAMTSGCNLAFFAVIMCLAQPGDEIILPVPWYFNHQMTLTLLGLKPVPLPTFVEDGFCPSPELLSSLITSKTKALALVTPNNPTGAIYSPALIAQFHSICREKKIALILDETYRDFLSPTSYPPHSLFSTSDWRSSVIHLFSFSKSYCLPGHRLGLIAASPALVHGPITKVLDTVQICAPRPIQIALSPLLPELRSFLRTNALSIAKKHAIFRSNLPPKWSIGSQGGYYAFVRHPFARRTARDVCKRLVTDLGVATLPEEFFCEPGTEGTRWIRVSVANVEEQAIRQMCERLAGALETWGWEVEAENKTTQGYTQSRQQ